MTNPQTAHTMSLTPGLAKSVPLVSLGSAFDLSKAFDLPHFTIETDWYGEVPCAKSRFCIARMPGHLIFSAIIDASPIYDITAKSGHFVEKLWEKDVAEFFLKDKAGYLEFNLAASGAWWAMAHDNYRVRSTVPVQQDGVTTIANVETGRWKAAMSIPATAFRDRLPEKGDLLNVTAIIGSGSEQQFLSLAKIEGEPDFHKSEHFLPLLPLK